MAVWTRRGLVVTPPRGDARWASHAQIPTVLALAGDRWRIYFAARDEDNRATVFAADVDPRDEMRVLDVHAHPLLEPGEFGAFDAAGLGPSCALLVDGRIHLYYVGVAARADVPHPLAIGLAVSDDGLAFERATTGPVLSIGPYDPFFVSAPFVRHTATGYEMWYMSATRWLRTGGRVEAEYVVRHSESADGVVWSSATSLALAAGDPNIVAVARPWIARCGGRTQLWFSHRGADFRGASSGAYRLAHAPLGDDGKRAAAPIERVHFENPPRPGDWDDRMQAYPCVVPSDDGLVMFYNGNDFGRHGFGWATAVCE